MTEDLATGTYEMRREVATEAGASIAVLDGPGHFWMTQEPAAGARVLNDFWAGLR